MAWSEWKKFGGETLGQLVNTPLNTKVTVAVNTSNKIYVGDTNDGMWTYDPSVSTTTVELNYRGTTSTRTIGATNCFFNSVGNNSIVLMAYSSGLVAYTHVFGNKP